MGNLGNRVSLEHKAIRAVDDVSVTLERGKLVGHIDTNGAGKSTTIKMLMGILVPTSERIDLMAVVPSEEQKQNTSRICVVLGERTQFWCEFPVIDSFELLMKMYDVPQNIYKQNVEFLNELLQPFLSKPVRNFSLGQRIRGSLTAALWHDPQILYLDGPTIRLDVVTKKRFDNPPSIPHAD